jgi:hypothetical protein
MAFSDRLGRSELRVSNVTGSSDDLGTFVIAGKVDIVNTKRAIFVVLNLLILPHITVFAEHRAISHKVEYHRIDFMSCSLVCPIISRSESTEVDGRQRAMFFFS